MKLMKCGEKVRIFHLFCSLFSPFSHALAPKQSWNEDGSDWQQEPTGGKLSGERLYLHSMDLWEMIHLSLFCFFFLSLGTRYRHGCRSAQQSRVSKAPPFQPEEQNDESQKLEKYKVMEREEFGKVIL